MRWQLAAALFWTFLIMALCWLPLPMFPLGTGGEHPKAFPHLDKLVHAGIFAVFGLLWLRAVPGKHHFLFVLAAGAALAAITEYGQSLPIIGRDGGVADGVFDVIGVFASYPLARYVVWRERGPKTLAAAPGA